MSNSLKLNRRKSKVFFIYQCLISIDKYFSNAKLRHCPDRTLNLQKGNKYVSDKIDIYASESRDRRVTDEINVH